MKKSLIAAGAASFAVAAMPVVGVFATVVPMSNGASNGVVDTVTLTVSKTCQMEVDSSKVHTDTTTTYGDTYNLGTSTVAHVFDGSASGQGPNAGGTGVTGTVMTLTCNSNGDTDNGGDHIGWNLTASATALSSDSTDQSIPFGAFATTGESVWSAKIALSGNDTDNAAITSGWDDWASASDLNDQSKPTGTVTNKVILSGTADTAVSGLVVTPSYKAYGAAHQPAGTYEGTITYTFHDLTPSI